MTIDGADAKDLDDAISVKKLPNGNFELGVHIADVAEYVREYLDPKRPEREIRYATLRRKELMLWLHKQEPVPVRLQEDQNMVQLRFDADIQGDGKPMLF